MGDISEVADRIIALGEKLAAPAAEVALGAARMEAISCLVSGAFFAVVASILAYAAVKFWASQPEINSYDLPTRKIVAGIMAGIAGIMMLFAIWAVIDPWTWATISHPELYLAKRILGL